MKMKIFICLCLIALVPASLVSYAQTFSVIHAFTGGADGRFPNAGVTIRGNSLFGTTSTSGDFDDPSYGVVYQVYQSGSQWITTPISQFTDFNGPRTPEARVMFGPDGHLYSTTSSDGHSGDGTVFLLTPPLSACKTAKCSSGSWAQTVLHTFVYPDGYNPGSADIAFDPQANLYGTTLYGGGSNGDGTVYELQRSGSTWTESILYIFKGQSDGRTPAGGVIRDNNGNLFGTTVGGGMFDLGTVWELTNVPGVGWVETILYKFQNALDGISPWAGLVMDQSGNLYGGTSTGGTEEGGTIFELSPAGNTWTYNVLYNLPGSCGPQASLTIDTAGSLYGTTPCGGAAGKGNVFKLTKTGNGWQYTSLYDFTGGADGELPMSNVSIDTAGTLYGTTSYGGSFEGICGGQGCGVVWMIRP